MPAPAPQTLRMAPSPFFSQAQTTVLTFPAETAPQALLFQNGPPSSPTALGHGHEAIPERSAQTIPLHLRAEIVTRSPNAITPSLHLASSGFIPPPRLQVSSTSPTGQYLPPSRATPEMLQPPALASEHQNPAAPFLQASRILPSHPEFAHGRKDNLVSLFVDGRQIPN